MLFTKQNIFDYLAKAMLLIVAVGILIFSSCNEPVKEQDKAEAKPAALKTAPGYNPYEDLEMRVEVFKIDSIEHNGSKGWGYDILINGIVHIHQPNIPAVMGNNGFSSEEKALIAGEYVIRKIKNNILPPAVTPEELDSLGVLN